MKDKLLNLFFGSDAKIGCTLMLLVGPVNIAIIAAVLGVAAIVLVTILRALGVAI